ncbi:enoyl-CoA hydratase-related protein [Peredibacter starrii]|uniref:Enoyl-CoA hydratase-related protein n=1 Tax=Peredibacter starrii TaxID=28202 RepID=A0AAX4HSJ9_9BACT|nr:enoyl-CoA hydratase-related protein [Peredibacter starrii]WPU66366.1 enoyl-CoA hydratase-related protein [Peredibacter starrii]
MSFYLRPFEDLLVEKKKHTLWITLNRPEASNAYSTGMVKALVEVLRFADIDNEIRAIVITGAGKNFCAGGDVKAMKGKSGMFAGGSNELRETYQAGIQQIPATIVNLKTPVIAMVNGAAVGAGCDLAAMCDMRIASEEAVFAETFAKVGLVPGDGGAFFLTRLIGFGKAMEMFLTCKMISATEAKNIGLVNQVVLPNDLKNRTEELADHLATLPPIALQMTKKAVIHSYQNDLNSHLELMAAYQGITQRSSDHFKALDGMIEKKTPTFDHN